MHTVAGRAARRQAGATLVVALIMLVVMTLLVVTSYNLGRSELQVISNMQWQSEAQATAQLAIEEVISNRSFTTNAASVFPSPCGAANTQCYDTNGDTKTDVMVLVKSRADAAKPSCVTAKVVKNSDLNLNDPYDKGCAVGVVQGQFGIQGASTGNSECADSLWEVQAEAVDQVTRARAVVTQGVYQRVHSDAIAVSCP